MQNVKSSKMGAVPIFQFYSSWCALRCSYLCPPSWANVKGHRAPGLLAIRWSRLLCGVIDFFIEPIIYWWVAVINSASPCFLTCKLLSPAVFVDPHFSGTWAADDCGTPSSDFCTNNIFCSSGWYARGRSAAFQTIIDLLERGCVLVLLFNDFHFFPLILFIHITMLLSDKTSVAEIGFFVK